MGRLLVIGLLAGCGVGEVVESGPKLVFQDEPRCLSCDVPPEAEQAPVEAASSVRALPTELLFYPIHGADNEDDPGWTTVSNHYDFIVFLTRVTLEDDLTPGVRSGGASYFTIEPLDEWIELAPEEGVALPVWFNGSEKQQSAILEIFTTAYNHRRLAVALTGKTLFE